MNKVLVLVYVPLLEKKYEVWIPINRKVYAAIFLIAKEINRLMENDIPLSANISFYNRMTGNIYDRNLIIKDTDIRNGTELVLI